ncbi:aspartic peptidase [Zunongwangia sp. F363]|uniref:Aspartic peptidase n=1 Tax=Autumnicola tepida TaxID=3075595 RepID=A0ABU3CBX7_9FLAO|nr:aspartic peptidase [Zunongwangia sp. F363]MDT0643540.1 aspartic peptidase [Zunongwangia sp. F363]
MKYSVFIFLSVFILQKAFSQKAPNAYDNEGKRHGLWKVFFEGTNQPKFEGNFEHGQEVGKFSFYKKGFPEHPSAVMNFEKDKDSIQVTYFTQKGEPISTGKMVDKKREGKWVYYHQSSLDTMMTEEYKHDKLNGLQKTFFRNGQVTEETMYNNDLKDGKSFVYSEGGTLLQKLNFREGELQGPAEYYNAKGEKIIEGQYNKDRKTGTWYYFENGEVKKEKEY